MPVAFNSPSSLCQFRLCNHSGEVGNEFRTGLARWVSSKVTITLSGSKAISQAYLNLTTTCHFSQDRSVVMADSQLPGSKRVRLEKDGVDEPDFSIPSGSTSVEVQSRAEQLGHTHAKR